MRSKGHVRWPHPSAEHVTVPTKSVGEPGARSPGAMLLAVDYPATREDIVRAAADEGAPPDAINFLKSLPDRRYESPDDALRSFAEASARFGLGGTDVRHRDRLGKEATEPEGRPAPLGRP